MYTLIYIYTHTHTLRKVLISGFHCLQLHFSVWNLEQSG